MIIEQGLLSAIRDEPDDDLPRLVLADWYDDNGDSARAEFIRTQVRLAALPEYDAERFELELRALALLGDHQKQWLSHLPNWARELKITFRRGLPECIAPASRTWLKHGGQIAKLLPLAQVRTGARTHCVEAARRIAQTGVTDAFLDCPEQNHDVAAVFRELAAGRLRRLLIGGVSNQINLSALFLGWPGLPRLTNLVLFAWPTGAITSLLASPDLGAMQWLWLDNTRHPDWLALASNDQLAGLRRLFLGGNGNSGPVGLALANAYWPNLEEFELEVGVNGSDEMRRLIGAPWAAGLRSLKLPYYAIFGECSRTTFDAELPPASPKSHLRAVPLGNGSASCASRI